MVLCHPDCVPFLPSQWQDLAAIDKEIIDDFKTDQKALIVFLRWLDRLSFPLFSSFVETHPDLCKGAVRLADFKIKYAYAGVIRCVNKITWTKSGSTVYWRGYDRAGLPARWQQAAQEERLIAHVTTNWEDYLRLANGVVAKPALFALDYPRLAQHVMHITKLLQPSNQKVLAAYDKVFRAITK